MSALNQEQLRQFDEYLKSEYGSIDEDGEQNKKYEAMTAFGRNVLLSAGAGCGKTTTLSLRVAYQILAKDISVSDMLILTFTNNAATEMKDRIKDDLVSFASDRERYPFIGEEAARLLVEEADKVDTAQISTFDSFSNSIVKKYADELDISPSFSLLDDSVSDFIFSKEENDVINAEFEDESTMIKEFFDRYMSANNSPLRSMISTLEKIRTKVADAELLFDHWEETYLSFDLLESMAFECLKRYCNKIDVLADTLMEFAKDYCEVYAVGQKVGYEPNFFHQAADFLHGLSKKYTRIANKEDPILQYDSSEAIRMFDAELDGLSFKGKKDGSDGKLHPASYYWFSKEVKEVCLSSSDDKKEEELEEQRNTITNTLKSIHEDIAKLLPNYESLILMRHDAKYINYAISIDRKIHERVEAKKRENNSYSFADISNMCLDLLEHNDDIRIEEKGRIKSIMVDEYQDSNMLQEKLLALLGTSEENLGLAKEMERKTNKPFLSFHQYLFDRNITFMVGDVKQSIYGFREARPSLFMAKYDNPAEHNFTLLTMRDNYRSTNIVVGEVNRMFERNMTTELGGVEYKNDRNQQIKSSNPNLKVISTGDYRDVASLEYDFEDPTIPEDRKLKSQNLRRHVVALDLARKIKKWVENGTLMVASKKKGEAPRPTNYSDFAILVRAKSEADPYVDAFASLNMPCVMDFNQDFKDSTMVMVLENLVKLQYYLTLLRKGEQLDEAQKDSYRHCIASIERSFLMDVRDVQIVKDMENAFSTDVEKRPMVLIKLDEINDASDIDARSPNQIIREIFDVFEVYPKISTLSHPDDSMASYNFFMGEIDSLSKMGFTYMDFVDFFTSLREGDLSEITQESKLYRSKENSIQITTIHKSKGLEYPFVIVPMGTKKPQVDRANPILDFDEDIGFIPGMAREDRDFLRTKLPSNQKGDEDWNPDIKEDLDMYSIQSLVLRQRRESEAISEHLRILYVALTRARIANIMMFTDYIFDKRRSYKSTRLDTKSFEDFAIKSYGSFKIEKGNATDYVLDELVLPNGGKEVRDYDKEEIEKAAERFKVKLVYGLDPETLWIRTKQTSRASKADTIKASKKNERFGTKLHLELECLDWSKYPTLPDTSFMADARERNLIDSFVNSSFISSLDGQNPKFFQELGFIDPDSGHEGSIDLAITTDDKSYVIDYKTSSTIDPAYRRQVYVYKKNLARLFTIDPIRIECYLYSIMKGEFVKVDTDEIEEENGKESEGIDIEDPID